MSEHPTGLPARPSLEQLRKQARELLLSARSGDASAIARLSAAGPPRAARAHAPILADAQLAIARELGFRSWPHLVGAIEGTRGEQARPMIRPGELRTGRQWPLADGSSASTDDVWRMFVATRDGDLAGVRTLVARTPALAVVEYNYTPPIHFAVREGHAALTTLLLDLGADLAYRSYPFGDSLLMMAEDREHRDVAALLRDRLSRRFALGPDTSGIIAAAREGDTARVQAELARDPRLARTSNETGDTALHHAAQRGHLDVVRVLLAAGANADAVRGDGYRPIHLVLTPRWLVGDGDRRAGAIADALLAAGARYTTYVAALRGDHGFVREALARDRGQANAEDTCHHRPISAAVRRGDVALARLLLEHGADPSLPEEGAPRGQALWTAVHERRRDLVQLLLAHGADPNGMVESSGTPMGQAERDPELRDLLRAHGGKGPSSDDERLGRLIADRDLEGFERYAREHLDLVRDEDASWGDGILAGPANAGDHEVLALLLRLGARVPPVSKWAPYYYFKHEKTAAFLLEHGMDPNHMNWHRFTLLHHMAAEGELGKLRLLLDHGAAIDAVDEEYRSTPLGVAARRGQLDAVVHLLSRGADPAVAGAAWATPMAWALKRGHAAVAAALDDHARRAR